MLLTNGIPNMLNSRQPVGMLTMKIVCIYINAYITGIQTVPSQMVLILSLILYLLGYNH